jgi:hypothetical protein
VRIGDRWDNVHAAAGLLIETGTLQSELSFAGPTSVCTQFLAWQQALDGLTQLRRLPGALRLRAAVDRGWRPGLWLLSDHRAAAAGRTPSGCRRNRLPSPPSSPESSAGRRTPPRCVATAGHARFNARPANHPRARHAATRPWQRSSELPDRGRDRFAEHREVAPERVRPVLDHLLAEEVPLSIECDDERDETRVFQQSVSMRGIDAL